jgi:hypothetical protein
MRHFRYLAVVAATAAVVAAQVGMADAASVHVLTNGMTGGTAVQSGAVLTASLAAKTPAVFSLNGEKLTCTSSSLSAKVTSNPTAPGKATESLTALKLGKCKVNVSGVKLKTTKLNNLPYTVTISDAKNFPVTATGHSKSKPLSVTVTVVLSGQSYVCSYTAKSVAGTAANKGNTVKFSGQKLTVAKGSNSACAKSADFSATYGPLTNSSAAGKPKVFIN